MVGGENAENPEDTHAYGAHNGSAAWLHAWTGLCDSTHAAIHRGYCRRAYLLDLLRLSYLPFSGYPLYFLSAFLDCHCAHAGGVF